MRVVCATHCVAVYAISVCIYVCIGLPLTQTIVGKGQAVPYQPVTAQQALSVSSPPPQGSNARLHGEGLTKATVGQTAQFVIDSKGNRGDVHILVEGTSTVTLASLTLVCQGRR